MWLYIGLGALAIFWAILGIFEWLGVKKAFEHGRTLSKKVSIGWGILGVIGVLLIAVISFFRIWSLPINKEVALIVGLAMLGIGTIMMIAGMIEFHSIRRVLGQDISSLITTGIYSWSRNPLFLGRHLLTFGISLLGRSGLAFLFTIIGILYYHFYVVKLEEPFLERIFGEEYRQYKLCVPRYIGILKRKENEPDAA